VSEKLVLVDGYFSGWEKWGIRGFVVPALTTGFYIYVYPWIALPVYRFVQKRQAELQRVRQEFEDEKPLPQKEARELRQALEMAQEQFDALISRKERQIQAQGNEITSLQKALDEATSRVSRDNAVLNPPPAVPENAESLFRKNATSASTVASNPPLPFPTGVEKVGRTVLIPKGAEAKPPTAAALRDHYGNTAAGLSQFEKEVMARIFEGETGNEFVSASDISPDDSSDALKKFADTLRSLEERRLVEFENGRLRLTPAGMNVVRNFVKNFRL
jgi:hypothetical protein